MKALGRFLQIKRQSYTMNLVLKRKISVKFFDNVLLLFILNCSYDINGCKAPSGNSRLILSF